MYSNQNQNYSNDNNQQGCMDKLKEYYADIPLFVRFIIFITFIFYILSWYTSSIFILLNIPLFTIYNFQLWRIITSVFFTSSLINIIFAFIAWIPDAIKLEKASGTIKYFFNFIINSILIQILYTLISYLISFVFPQILLIPSSGLWPLLLSEITILCLTNPESNFMMFLIPFMIKAKYYPWALFGLFILLNMTIQFDILSGILYGYIFFYYLKDKLQFSDEFINKVENLYLINKLNSFESFISLSRAMSFVGGNSFFFMGVNRNNNNNNNRIQERPNVPVTTPFRGVGTLLGSKRIYKVNLINIIIYIFLTLIFLFFIIKKFLIFNISFRFNNR
jgi:membrane associated rhomboid family serine protease